MKRYNDNMVRCLRCKGKPPMKEIGINQWKCQTCKIGYSL